MMTIDEAIRHCEEVAEKMNDCECAADHRQLAEWLRELKELREIFSKVDTGAIKPKDYLDLLDEWAKARKLLKAAVEDLRWVNENTQDADGTCIMRKCEGCGDCPLDIKGDLWCKWKHEAEALKLIGEEGDANG